MANGYSCALLVRMLFSCLVDADFLATEAFMDAGKARQRSAGGAEQLRVLQGLLDAHYAELDRKTAEAGRASAPVNLIRNEVKADCLKAADLPPGLFTLTVPTGGGKTLSSMAFALRHAVKHGLRRVVYVIPYTSIIEQNAKVFRDVFGEDAVLEHHCNVDYDRGDSRMKLLAENWDAPVVVTTNVQFFESLHANRTSRCRKLHNLAKAVIILDEAQALPADRLQPCLRALDELVMRYGASVALCTATQPSVLAGQLEKGGLTGGALGCREIIAPERNLHKRLRRVEAERIPGKISDGELIERFEPFPQLLAVVSTRPHARALFAAAKAKFGPDGVFHLSAQMCPQHRSDVLERIKARLAAGEPCRVVSTQIIEAGVDIDFPCVFREIAGADSDAQAAGRCNREGRLPGLGRFFLFESADFELPRGFLRTAAEKCSEVMGLRQFADDLLAPEATEKYFGLLYDAMGDSLDKYDVLKTLIPPRLKCTREGLLGFRFRTLGECFKMIDDNAITVFAPYGDEGKRLCESLRREYAIGEQKKIARKLQRYAVSLYGNEPRDGNGNPIAELVHGVYWALTSPELNYSNETGIVFESTAPRSGRT